MITNTIPPPPSPRRRTSSCPRDSTCFKCYHRSLVGLDCLGQDFLFQVLQLLVTQPGQAVGPGRFGTRAGRLGPRAGRLGAHLHPEVTASGPRNGDGRRIVLGLTPAVVEVGVGDSIDIVTIHQQGGVLREVSQDLQF